MSPNNTGTADNALWIPTGTVWPQPYIYVYYQTDLEMKELLRKILDILERLEKK